MTRRRRRLCLDCGSIRAGSSTSRMNCTGVRRTVEAVRRASTRRQGSMVSGCFAGLMCRTERSRRRGKGCSRPWSRRSGQSAQNRCLALFRCSFRCSALMCPQAKCRPSCSVSRTCMRTWCWRRCIRTRVAGGWRRPRSSPVWIRHERSLLDAAAPAGSAFTDEPNGSRHCSIRNRLPVARCGALCRSHCRKPLQSMRGPERHPGRRQGSARRSVERHPPQGLRSELCRPADERPGTGRLLRATLMGPLREPAQRRAA